MAVKLTAVVRADLGIGRGKIAASWLPMLSLPCSPAWTI
jgi:hypothetical protein